MIAGLPGVEVLATAQMRKEMERLDMFKLTKDDLVPQVKDVLTAMEFMDMSEGAQIIFI
jgi:peroxiredoxin family protein